MNRQHNIKVNALGDALASTLTPEAQRYWQENADRIASNIGDALSLCEANAIHRVLDVGPSFQTVIFKALQPGIEFETMGWEDARYRPASDTVHHPLDLNHTANPDSCITPPPFDLILLLEVIEHLYTSPRHILRYFYRCLKPGGLIVISTPNAAYLRNRFRLLFGANPFEHLREDVTNPGHFREYTRAELIDYCNVCGFDVIEARTENLFRYGSTLARFFAGVAQRLPQSFRRDMTIIARKRAG
jgi:SAM-dependent methyltransferase